MKTSNLILLGVLAAIFFFMAVLQIRMNHYVKEEVIRDYGPFVNKTRSVSEFKKIAVNDGIKVIFEQNDTMGIEVSAREGLIDFVTTKVIEETLVVEKTKRIREKDSVHVFVSNARLDSLNVSGASFLTKGTIVGDKLKLVFENEAEGNLELDYEIVECAFSRSSKVSITGNSKKINFKN